MPFGQCPDSHKLSLEQHTCTQHFAKSVEEFTDPSQSLLWQPVVNNNINIFKAYSSSYSRYVRNRKRIRQLWYSKKKTIATKDYFDSRKGDELAIKSQIVLKPATGSPLSHCIFFRNILLRIRPFFTVF